MFVYHLRNNNDNCCLDRITNNFGRVLARNRVASGKREMESGLSRDRLINRRRFVVGIHFGGLDKGWKLKRGVVIIRRKVGGGEDFWKFSNATSLKVF